MIYKIKLNLDQNLKNRDEIATSTVRLILAAIKDHDIQNRTKKKGEFISDEDIFNSSSLCVTPEPQSIKILDDFEEIKFEGPNLL